MDVKKLRYFAAIVEEGQISRAAKKLHMAQPPLSQQLKMLEEELEIKLLERKKHSIELTEAGKVLYTRAREVLEKIEAIQAEIKEIGDGIRGQLEIGSVKTCFAYIPEKIRLFRETYPEVTFRLYEGDSYQLANHLRNRDIELAIVRLPLDLNDFFHLPLLTDDFVLVASSDTGLGSPVQIAEIKCLPLMLLHRVRGVGLYELVLNEWKRHGLEPNIVCQCSDAAMLLSLVKAGIGVAILPRSTLLSFALDGLKMIEVTDFSIESQSAIIWLKERHLSKKAVRFKDCFTQMNQVQSSLKT
ncbi:LysR family transcriptional regulator [Bacillus testis]|uniref:LysR family transcriptional regulator n=1 Tax=Bacillus testis TaxID=1622072 RepID=UPI00067EC6C0|nr:LysR family transcriptional regulator [Bacillus testis]